MTNGFVAIGKSNDELRCEKGTMKLTILGKISITAGAAMMLAPGLAPCAAQTPPPAVPSIAANPILLPSDAPPPPMERMLAPPAVPTPGAAPVVSVPNTTPALSMALAVELAQAAVATCTAQGLRVGAAVSDAAGNLRVGLTGDGARPGRIFTASRKNVAVIAFGMPTSEIQAKLRADPALLAQVKPNMAVMPGGIPVMSGGKIIGALAVSGATSLQDEACANAALVGMQERLR